MAHICGNTAAQTGWHAPTIGTLRHLLTLGRFFAPNQPLPPTVRHALPMNTRISTLWRSRLLTALAALLGLWLLGWLVLPWLLKPLLEKQASQALGRQVTVEAVEVYPWSLTLALRDLRVASADGNNTQLSVQRATVDAAIGSVLRLAPVLDAVKVEHPVLHLAHLGQGQLDVQDIIDRLNPPDAPPKPDTAPARMAVYNIELLDGELTLSDGDRKHQIDHLNLSVPFIDTLGNAQALRKVRVQPKLSFRLNDSPFDTAAQTQPFDESLSTQATLKVSELDLSPYLGYLPKDLPVHPTRAVLGADLAVTFHQLPTPTVVLTGSLSARDLAVSDASGAPVLALRSAHITLADVRPLQRVAQLGEVVLEAPQIHLQRGASAPLTDTEKTKTIAKNPLNKSAVGQKSTKKSEPAWALGLQTLSVAHGQVNWQDHQVNNGAQHPAQLALSDWQVQASQLHWPLPSDAAQPTRVDTSASLSTGLALAKAKAASPGNGAWPPAHLSITGQVLASGADLRLQLNGLALPWLAPYIATHLNPAIQGGLDMDGRITWHPADPKASTPSTSPGPSAPAFAFSPTDELTLALDKLTLSQLRLTPTGIDGKPAPSPISLDKLEVTGASVQPLARRAQLGRILLTRPQLTLQRLPNGQLAAEQWLATPAAAAPSAAPPTTTAPPNPAADALPWDWQLAALQVTDGQLAWRDEQPPQAVALQATALQLSLKGLAARGNQAASLQTSLKLGATNPALGGPDNAPASLDWRGTVTLGTDGQSPQASGELVAKRLPVHALAPYAAGQTQLQLLRAAASYGGTVSWAGGPNGPRTHLSGDVTLEDVQANTLARAATADTAAVPAEPLLRWKTLNLKGVDLQLAPATPTRVRIQSGAVADFFARVAILPSGRINLQDAFAPTPATATATATSTPSANSPPAAPQHAAAAPANAASIQMGPFSLINGEVDFSDAYIRPNYQARLSDLTGRLGGFSSQPSAQPGEKSAPADMAELTLKGRAEGTASLEISGRINPLAQPLVLDIQGQVRDLELPALSPYAIKYTGHGIERGKLSLDVAYTLQPDGQLTARNQLVLNRLTFSEPVPGAPTSLPVKLAVALLADRQGVIDLNLPLQGSLNDPEFKMMPILFKILGNLLVKAATAPFSLLASALGGNDDELGSVAFVPGTTQLAPNGEATLVRLAKALADRPRLALTVAGTANLAAERDAYQRTRLDEQLSAEARRDTGSTAAPDDKASPTTMDMPTRQRWLAQLYRRTDMPKPRNALGVLTTIAPEDMQALLLAQIPVTEAAMHTLAVQRAATVRDALAQLKVPPQRLFTANPQLQAPTTPGTWRPSAQLTLTVP